MPNQFETGLNPLSPNADSNQFRSTFVASTLATFHSKIQFKFRIPAYHYHVIIVCQLTVYAITIDMQTANEALIFIFFVHDIPAIAKENCVKDRIPGKETAPVNAFEKVKESEVNYIFATCNSMHATLHLKITT